MKYFAIILILLLVALSACSSQQLPPEPVTPSSVGNYYKAVGEWAVEPLSFTLASPEQISCYAGNLVPITGFVTGDDFVYKNYYVWSQSLQGWYSDTYDSGDVVESTNWIRGDASFSDSILCEDLLEYADSTGEIYVVTYACSWDGSDWDCYDNKWQLQVFQVTEIAAPTCVDSDGGIEYTTQGSVVTNTDTATDFCSGSSLTEYSCSPTNTLESVLYTCPDGCSAGECLPAAPVEPTTPTQLQGSIFGLEPFWNSAGDYSNVFDGNVNTYYDYANANGGYVGVELDNFYEITEIRYVPRSGYEERMVGGEFQVSSDGQSYQTIHTVSSIPSFAEQRFSVSGYDSVKFVRYLSPLGSYGNIAEMEVYGRDGITGCTIAEALNYNSQATTDDGSCVLPVTSGVSYREYPGNYNVIADFASQDVDARATTQFTSTIGIPSSSPSDFIGLVLDAQLDVPTTGTYTFYLTSDDGSTLFVNGAQVINNDGLHAEVTESTTVSLNAGRVPITVYFFEKGGGQVLTLEYEGPGIPRQVIPASKLNRALYGCMNPSDGNYNQYASHSDSSQCAVIVTSENGVCGSSVNSCSAGTFVDQSDTSTQYLWQCAGVNGGTTASCSRSKTITTTPSDGGLFWNNDLLTAWQDRAVNGPYIVTGDAYQRSIGDWSRIETNALAFKANPQADRVLTNDQFRVFDGSSVTPASGSLIMNHLDMLDASLYSLVKEDQVMKDLVKQELLWHATRSYLQAPSPYVYDSNFNTDKNNWLKSEYFVKILVMTDLLREEFTESEWQDMANWLLPWARVFDEMVHQELAGQNFGNRYNRDYENNLGVRARTDCLYFSNYAYQDASGNEYNEVCGLHRMYNNRRAANVQFFGIAGVLFDDATLKEHAKIYFEEWLQFHVFPDGSSAESERDTETNVHRGTFLYMSSIMHQMTSLAYAFHSAGDNSLFEYSTCNGLWGTECKAGNSPKSLRLVIDTHFDMMQGKILRYEADVDFNNLPVVNGYQTKKEDFLLDKENLPGQTRQWENEVSFGPLANMYYKDPVITASYKRLAPGSTLLNGFNQNSYGTRLSQGNAAQFPGMAFMYADLEDISLTIVYGCTDSVANNYNATATADDGSCTYNSGGGTFTPNDGGLFWNDDLVTAWKDRAQNGPFKSLGDTVGLQGYNLGQKSPGEWDRIVSSKTSFMSNPSANRITNIVSLGKNDKLTKMVDASLYALVMDDASVAQSVTNELLWHARNVNIPSGWGQDVNTDNNHWWKTSALARSVVSLDLIRNYVSESDFQEISAWITDWALFYESAVHYELSLFGYTNRENRDYDTEGHWVKNSGFRSEGDSRFPDGLYAYQDGSGTKKNQIAVVHKYYNNRKTTVMQFVGLAAAVTEDPFLLDRSKLYFEEWLQFAVFPDGSMNDYQRSGDYASPIQGLVYSANMIESAVTVAYALANIGDDSLFTFKTCNGKWGTQVGDGGECNSGENPKDLKLVVETHFDLIEHKKDWYASKVRLCTTCNYVEVDLSNPPLVFNRQTTKEDFRIDNRLEIRETQGTTKQWVNDLWFGPIGNMYWKDQRITQGYLRNAPNAISYDESDDRDWLYDFTPWRGHGSIMPSYLFMYADLEGVTN